MKLLKRILKWIARAVALLLVIGLVCAFIAYWRSTNDCQRLAASPANPMKGMVYCDYGLANLKLADLEKPVPMDDQVLIRVRAASVNPYDWHFVEGIPKIMRLGVGLRKPKDIRLGVDYSGTVEAVGKNVTQFKPGDDVFGGRGGAFAEYVCVRQNRLVAPKPSNITFEEAASVDIAGVTALQALRDAAQLQAGQKILINGASGGVGTFAVQIAKWLGADVTGVCSTRNVDLVRSIGADHVIDYTKDDFTKGEQRYDVILDNVGNRPLSECRHALTSKGKLILNGGGFVNDQGWIGPMVQPLKAMLIRPFVSQEIRMKLTDATQSDLLLLGDLMRSGKLKPVIDRLYKLTELAEALAYVEQGHARGKVAITIP